MAVVCAWCWYARQREDICGIYCTGGLKSEDGECDKFLDYEEVKRGEKVAFKTNVVKRPWRVSTRTGYHQKDYIVMAESKTAAILKVPVESEIVSVEPIYNGEEDEKSDQQQRTDADSRR